MCQKNKNQPKGTCKRAIEQHQFELQNTCITAKNLRRGMKTTCHVVSWMESWNRKGTLGIKQGNLNELWTLINTVSILDH